MVIGVDFALSEDQTILRNLVERFAADHYDATLRAQYRAMPTGYSPENWVLLANLGFLALPFAEADGGLASSDIDIITVLEAVGRGLIVEPLIDEILIGGALLAAAGTLQQKERWIPRIIAGSAHVVLAHAEHDARFDLKRCDTRLRSGALDGSKTFVPGGADAYVVTAREGNASRLCLVAADAPGLRRRDYRRVDGSVASELSFTGVRAEAMLGDIETVEAVADAARIAATAEMVGIMTLLFDTTLNYVRERQQFGVPIGSFQAIQHRLADLYVSLEQSRSLLYRSALATADERAGAIASAKSFISTAAVRLGEECIQFHGGIGISDELLIGHGHKRILLLASMFGDADYELVRYDRIRRGLSTSRHMAPESGPTGCGMAVMQEGIVAANNTRAIPGGI